jgi:hypothetical protein
LKARFTAYAAGRASTAYTTKDAAEATGATD